jgi:hypothetical protein
MLTAFLQAFRTPDLRKKLLFTVFIIAVFRLGSSDATAATAIGRNVLDPARREPAARAGYAQAAAAAERVAAVWRADAE